MAERVRLFISSPGDVAEERVLAARVVRRLADEYFDRLFVEPVIWEHEPLLATDTFQKQIPKPSQCDVMICMLWSRLGTRLPQSITRPDGTPYASGTEYEFEDAMAGFRRTGRPAVLVYRKTAEPVVSLRNREDLLARLAQREALDGFVRHWFHEETDGSLKAAFHQFETPAQFEEVLEAHLRKLLSQLAPPPVAGGEQPSKPKASWLKGSPFRGLEAFDFEHAPVFFGRTTATGGVMAALRRQASEGRAFVLVLGASGAGKSSLVRAGVIPLLTTPGVVEGVARWRQAVMRPGDASAFGDLFDALAASLLRPEALPELAADGTTADDLAKLLRGNPSGAGGLVKGVFSAQPLPKPAATTARPGGTRLVLLLDQLEELFTADRFISDARRSFFVAIDSLARGGRTWVLATLRSDYYARCVEIPELVALKAGAGQYDLPLPTPAEVSQMIRRPAWAAALRFEEDPATGVSLDDALRDDSAASPESLPLLQFALEALYQQRSEEGMLTWAAYQRIGGVEGALASRAEAVYTALPDPVRGVLPRVMRSLVAVAESATGARRKASLSAVTGGAAARALVDAFVEARLLVTDRAADGEPTLTLAHEALLRAWPRLAEWLEHDRELLRVRGRVSTAAARWIAESRSGDLLLSTGKPVLEAVALRDTAALDLTENELQFINASVARARRGRRLKRAAVSALAVLTCFAAVAAIYANGQRRVALKNEAAAVVQEESARKNEILATANERVATEQTGLARRAARDADLAFARSLIAQADAHMSAEQWAEAKARYNEAGRKMTSLGVSPIEADLGMLAAVLRAPPELCVLTQPTGIAETDPMVLGYYALKGRAIDSSAGALESVTAVSVGHDDRYALVGVRHAPMNLWHLPTGRRVRDFNGGRAGETAAALSPDGTWALSGGPGGYLIKWDTRTGSQLTKWKAHAAYIRGIGIAPDSKAAASLADDGQFCVWSMPDNAEICRGASPASSAGYFVSLSNPVGNTRRLFYTGNPAHAWVVAPDRVSTVVLPMVQNSPRSVFTQEGHILQLNQTGDRVTLYDAETNLTLAKVPQLAPDAHRAVFGGRYALVPGPSSSLRLVDLGLRDPRDAPDATASGVEVRRFTGHTEQLTNWCTTEDGRFGVSGSYDTTTRVWPLKSGGPYVAINLPGTDRRFGFVCHSHLLASVLIGRDEVELRDSETGTLLATRQVPAGSDGHKEAITAMDASPDGVTVAITCVSGSVILWDWAAGRFTTLAREKDRLSAVAYSADGRRLAWVGVAGVAHAWDLKEGQSVRVFQASNAELSSVALSPDGQLLAAAAKPTGGFLEERNLWVWDSRSGQRRPTPKVRPTAAVAFSADGSMLATAGEGGTQASTVLRTADLKPIWSSGRSLRNVAWLDKGAVLLSVGWNGKVYVTRSAALDDDRSLLLDAPGEPATVSTCFSADGERMATTAWSASNNALVLRIWNLRWATQAREMDGPLREARLSARDKGDPAALQVVARWHAFCGVWDWAAEALEKANSLGGTVPAFDVGRYQWAAGHKDEAGAWLHEAAKADPRADPYRELWYHVAGVAPLIAAVAPATRMSTTVAVTVPASPPTTSIAVQPTAGPATAPLTSRATADAAYVRGNYAAALIEYAELVKMDPKEFPLVALRLASLYAAAGRFSEAAEVFELRVEQQRDATAAYKAACLRAFLRNDEKFATDCRSMVVIIAGTSDRAQAERTAKACSLRPTIPVDTGVMTTLADRALAGELQDNNLPYFRLARAMVDYRQGRYREAFEWIEKLPRNFSQPEVAATIEFLASAVASRLGLPALAQERYEWGQLQESALPATPDPTQNLENWLICKIFANDAAELLGTRMPGAPATRPVISPGQSVDLLTLADSATPDGDWAGLASPLGAWELGSGAGSARVAFPVAIRGSYEVTAVFRRTGGERNVQFILATPNGGMFAFLVGGGSKHAIGKRCG